VPTWAGFIYLAVVLDAWSRRVVGWAIGQANRNELGQDGGHAQRRSRLCQDGTFLLLQVQGLSLSLASVAPGNPGRRNDT
jgi:transposase InsO family protein